MVDAKDIFTHITEAIKRRKASWGIGVDKATGKVVLAVGAPNTIRVPHGGIIAIGLSTEELLKLRDTITDLLKEKTQ